MVSNDYKHFFVVVDLNIQYFFFSLNKISLVIILQLLYLYYCLFVLCTFHIILWCSVAFMPVFLPAFLTFSVQPCFLCLHMKEKPNTTMDA